MNKKPFFSIGISTYQSSSYLKTCLDSILSQNYEDFEIIIVDDISTDNTSEIVEEYIKKDNRIHLYKNEKNIGILLTRQAIVSHASGSYFMWCDSDDEFCDGFLFSMHEIIEKSDEKNITIIHNASMIKSENDIVKKILHKPPIKNLNNVSSALCVNFANGYSSLNWIFVVPIGIVKKVYSKLPSENPRDYVDDALLSYKYCLYANKIVFDDRPFYKYYLRANSDSTNRMSIKNLYNTHMYIANNLENELLFAKKAMIILGNIRLAIHYALGDLKHENKKAIKQIACTIRKEKKGCKEIAYYSKKDKLLLFTICHCLKVFTFYYAHKVTRCNSKEENRK